jgi:hypothetical protein
MIVYNLYIKRVAGIPLEADTVLIVDSDAVLPLTPTSQALQSVARWASQVSDRLGGVQHE